MREVRCTGHGRSTQEARTGALGEVPGVRTEWGCYVGKVEARIDLEVTLGLCNPVSAGQRPTAASDHFVIRPSKQRVGIEPILY